MHAKLLLPLALSLGLAGAASAQTPTPSAPAPTGPTHREGALPDGAKWAIDVPANWNGTLLLYCHGYSGAPATTVRDAPMQGSDWLLAHGYAFAASSYAKPGWALEEAVPDQLATLDVFAKEFHKPKRVIVWGDSMGGLVTLALVEQHPDRFDGALPMCASVSGSVGMMNQALDAAFVLEKLSGAAEPVKILGDRAAIKALVDGQQATPAGRAHIALAAVIAQIPEWNNPKKARAAARRSRRHRTKLLRGPALRRFLPTRGSGATRRWQRLLEHRRQLFGRAR